MRRIPKLIFLIATIIFFFSHCQEKKEREISLSFYHWKTNFEITKSERKYLDSLSVKKLYVKFFDVDWNSDEHEAIPLADINFKSEMPEKIEIVPTIFITNRTLLKIADKNLDSLAKRVITRIKYFAKNNKIVEIQFDCDWTDKTREKYFEFLKSIKKIIAGENIILSATIRLHQVKYFKRTGVPPVDRGVLMFYNMGDLDNPETENSIIDVKIAKKYLSNLKKYPLDLDIALPLFSWGVVFRDGKLVKLINNLQHSGISDITRFKKIDKRRYEVVKSTYLQGYYLYEDDVIRIEEVKQMDLIQSVQLLNNYIDSKKTSFIFYHLDTSIIRNFPYEKLKIIFDNF